MSEKKLINPFLDEPRMEMGGPDPANLQTQSKGGLVTEMESLLENSQTHDRPVTAGPNTSLQKKRTWLLRKNETEKKSKYQINVS